ncbi:MAG TPA: GNAT family N-acetyltransferase [Acidimicrobiales bacterium]|nr:GNAT family N-acetyltransferase [Acidimicrobiales bacterium]
MIQTERLLLRQWRDEDLETFAALNADPEVMEFFPAVLSPAESDAAAEGNRRQIEEHGWGLWAVERLDTAEFIGFTGLWSVPPEFPFSPAVEVGWRLARSHWGHGFATEGARAAIYFGFGDLGLEEIVSMTTESNVRSWRVMEKLGMTRDPSDDFDHPRVSAGHRLRRHLLYRLKRPG